MSPDQEEAFEVVRGGHNLFLTGQGGTGKSYLIRRIYDAAKARGEDICVCALTGTAALLLECKATTLHRWAGIGIGDDMFDRATEKYSTVARWRKTKTLVVDEVSMMSSHMFDELDRIGKHIRKSPRPFGGLQVIFCGDFCQLPPIGHDVQYCFESAAWTATFPIKITLTSMHRQKDPVFCKILQEIRYGRLSKESFKQLKERILPNAGVTRLVPTRKKADDINATEYAKLTGDEHTYHMKDLLDYEMTPKKIAAQARFSLVQMHAELERMHSMRFQEQLQIKVGTRVMCTFNIDESTCNGSQGVVVRFAGTHPVVKFTSGLERIMWPSEVESEVIPGVAVAQVPLMYAWAVTIHKAQGASMDCAEIDIGNDVFEAGQTYVALSRLRSMEGLYLTSFDPSKIRMSAKAREFYKVELG